MHLAYLINTPALVASVTGCVELYSPGTSWVQMPAWTFSTSKSANDAAYQLQKDCSYDLSGQKRMQRYKSEELPGGEIPPCEVDYAALAGMLLTGWPDPPESLTRQSQNLIRPQCIALPDKARQDKVRT